MDLASMHQPLGRTAISVHSLAGKYPDAIEVSTSRRRRHPRVGLCAIVLSGVIGVFGAPTLVQASAITPKTFCAKISAATVSSLFGQKVTLLGALAEGGGVLAVPETMSANSPKS